MCGLLLFPLFLCGVAFPFYLLAVYLDLIPSELDSNITLLLILFPIGLYCARNFFLLYRFLTTLKYSIEYDSSGITLSKSGEVMKFAWKDIAIYKKHIDCEILCIFGPDGRHVISLWNYATNLREFKEVYFNHVDT